MGLFRVLIQFSTTVYVVDFFVHLLHICGMIWLLKLHYHLHFHLPLQYMTRNYSKVQSIFGFLVFSMVEMDLV